MKTLPKLIKEADEWFSKSVRLRDSEPIGNEYVGTCITCNKTGTVAWRDETGKLRFTKGWNAGHFVGRSNYVVRFNEMNVNLQCAFRCNNMRSGEPVKYKIALKEKYGAEVPGELEELAETTQYYKFTRDELEQVINDSKESIKFYERNL
jgi:hypothetical protein